MVRVFQAHKGYVRTLAWSPQGDRLASAGGDRLVKLWDPLRGAELARLQAHPGKVTLSVAWSPDGKRLASAGPDRLVIAWDAETRQKLSTMRGHSDFVHAVVWSPDGTWLGCDRRLMSRGSR
jgi:WD40 repeat protein